MTNPISRYRQRRTAERTEVAAGSDALLAAQGLIRASAEARVATPAQEGNAWTTRLNPLARHDAESFGGSVAKSGDAGAAASRPTWT